MTDWLYHTDSYLREFEASVTEVVDDGVVLDRTAFYPGGGGQPCDTGWLEAGGERWEVGKVRRKGGQVVHSLDREPPPAGVSLLGSLDWGRRYDLMRTHTAMHILCGVIWRDYGASVTGGKMQPLKGRMDFEFERMRKELVHEIEEKINVEVAAARAIHVQVLPRQEAFQIPDLIRTKINLLPPHITQVRVVEIEGLDMQADGGTHVANTSEVGPLQIVDYKSKGRMNKRLVVALAAATNTEGDGDV
jgi:misacylated tRNA(Ala) deacylase